MNHPQILALHTGLPGNCLAQDEVITAYIKLLHVEGKHRERAIRSVMHQSGVGFRHLAVETDFFSAPRSTQQRNDRYMAEALPLGARVIEHGLAEAGITAQDIDSFVVVSCTGFNTPGLDLLLAQQLKMPTHLHRTCVLGMGCYGAFPGLKRAWDSVAAHPNRRALMLSLEICTAHLQVDDATETIVSTSLFADGAGMVLIGAADPSHRGPTLIDTETYCDYQTLGHMTFNVTDQGFRMYLSSYVPDVLAANINAFVDQLLRRNHLSSEDVRFWAIHPGSKRIVEYIQEQLRLSDEQVSYSLDTLHEHGNMSSATVLFVLDRIMRQGAPQRGDYGVMMAFGPGLTMESMLIRW